MPWASLLKVTIGIIHYINKLEFPLLSLWPMETVIAFGLFLKQSNHLALEVLENVLFLNKL